MDYDIILLGVYYAVVILGYIIFEMIPINYRPILIEGRLVCGVHWFTDIVGAALLSGGLFCIYKAAVYLCYKAKN